MIFFEPLRPKQQPAPTIGKRIRVVIENGLPDMLEGTVISVDSKTCTFRLNQILPRPISPEVTDLESRKAVAENLKDEYTVPRSYLWAVEP